MRAGVMILCMTTLLVACAEDTEPLVDKSPAPAVVNGVPELAPIESGTVDPDSGLVIDEHWELVKAHCSACHSTLLVTQNRGTRQNWLDMIRWMQETQGLWQFDAATEMAILDYLEKHFAPSAMHRRTPLPGALMPENPYPDQAG